LEGIARLTRSLIGRLQVPTYQEWLDEHDRHEAYDGNCSAEEVRERRERWEAEYRARRASTPQQN
jgi:hypothetical protein